MHDVLWHSVIVREIDASEGELGHRNFTSIATAISHAAVVIKASSAPAVLAAREATAQCFLTLQ